MRSDSAERDSFNNSFSPGYGTVNATSPPPEQQNTEPPKHDNDSVSWSSLPQKNQLFILALARLSEPLTQTSLQSYTFHQLRSFDPSLSESTIATRAGILASCFTGAQFFTSLAWGQFADSPSGGRKRVLLIGLVGTAVSCLGFGFSRNFTTAVVTRTIGGALNGNVGVITTMVNEIVVERRFQSRAILIVPLCFNFGVIVGPMLGGVLADPVKAYPGVFGKHSTFGGEHGVEWMTRWPYALPNIVNVVFLSLSFLAAFFGLKETHPALGSRKDWGLRGAAVLGTWIRFIFCIKPRGYYKQIPQGINSDSDTLTPTSEESESSEADTVSQLLATNPKKQRLPFRQIWSRNVVVTLLAHAALAFHYGTFSNIWFIFLSASRATVSDPVHFSGGLGLSPSSVGLSMAILGLLGIIIQVTVYPTVASTFGTIRTYRASLLLFPVVYVFVPYLVFVPYTPSRTLPLWTSIVFIMLVQVLARTLSYPSTMILVNNCSPHPSVLATVHGLAQSMVSISRTFGPLSVSWAFGLGLDIGVVGLGWWILAFSAVLGMGIGWAVREDSGKLVSDDDSD
ncbi:MFS multidrug transporter [Paraphaeosphaeria sporulosa]